MMQVLKDHSLWELHGIRLMHNRSIKRGGGREQHEEQPDSLHSRKSAGWYKQFMLGPMGLLEALQPWPETLHNQHASLWCL